MKIIQSPQEMQEISAGLRISKNTIGFVPTMGALHQGHLSLIQKCRKENDTAVVSIFVNPIQFGPSEDYQKYPRSLPQDKKLLESVSADFLFVPEANEMFPFGYQTKITVESLSAPLCGKFRPGHFQGVATIVMKLFHIVIPTRAYFGEKDYQQFRIIKQMAADLNLPVEILPCPTVREPDGLAVSSRNQYLSALERKHAPLMYQSLLEGGKLVEKKEKKPEVIRTAVIKKLQESSLISIEYVEIVHPETLVPVREIDETVLLALAVRIGKTRLIDNLMIQPAS
ncbi:MAG: pantoate--beta-alanine ligase [Firmicutes bacterium]|nr:pantoate--beta-alanine ligase [Bacillota bacterium]